MKLSEFEEKLTMVSDAKLLQMLSASRSDGPDVAVKCILKEGRRRGLEGMEPESDESSRSHPFTKNLKVGAGVTAEGESSAEKTPGKDALLLDDEAPAGAANWLSEENSEPAIPVVIKIALSIVALGGLLFGAMKFIHRG